MAEPEVDTPSRLPWIWIEEDEREIKLPCGCMMWRAYEERDPAYEPCRMHKAAPALLEACQDALGALEVFVDNECTHSSDEDEMCKQLGAAIAAATPEKE